MKDENDAAGCTSPDVGEVDVASCKEEKFPGPVVLRNAGFQVVINQTALNAVREHAYSSLKAEICGVLVGDVYWDAAGPFVYVEAAIRGEFAASQLAGVTFTAETWAHVQQVQEKDHPGKKIVGWYHSHPDFGVFLSDMDLFIHRNFFNLPWQVALVRDPVRSEEGLFEWRGGKPEKAAFVTKLDASPKQFAPPATPAVAVAGGDGDIAHEIGRLRQNIKWLTWALAATLAISLIWPLVLVLVSRPRSTQPPPPAAKAGAAEDAQGTDANPLQPGSRPSTMAGRTPDGRLGLPPPPGSPESKNPGGPAAAPPSGGKAPK